MKLILNKIVAEFNKIYFGTKRVGDSLRVNGKKENELDVYNSSLLGHKSESSLNVNHAKKADNVEKLRSVNIDGNPDVDANGNPIYKTEQNLRVYNSQYLRDVAPENLEVDISRRLKVGDQPDSPIINVSSLIVDPIHYQVKDSSLLNGKDESALHVSMADNATNASKLDNTLQSELIVKGANYASYLKRPDGTLVSEGELYAYSSTVISKGTDSYDLYQLRNYILTHDQAKEIIPNVASSSLTISTPDGNKLWTEIQSDLKTNVDYEIYKTSHIIVGSDINAPVKTGDEYKDWIIGHTDFSDKVGTLTANIANRATTFGTSTENYNLSQMKTLITDTVVNNAANALKLLGKTDEDIISITRSRILSDSSNSTTGLVQNEVDGFFDNNKVKLKVQSIKVDAAKNTDTLETYSLSEIKQQVKNEGQVLSAKYIYADPNGGGQKSYIDITNDIDTASSNLVDNASPEYRTLGRTENVIKTNKTDVDNKLSTEINDRTSADNTLQSNIDIEKSRIDTIVNVANAGDPDNFKSMKTYTDTLNSNMDSRVTQNETDIANIQSSSQTSNASTQNELDKTQASAGLDDHGKYNAKNDANYIDSATTLFEADVLLDTQLKVEENDRIAVDTTLQSNIDNVVASLSTETANRTSADGDLTTLTTTNKDNLVASINEVNSLLSNEISDRGAADTTLQNNIDTVQSNLNTEVNERTTNQGNLNDLLTTSKSSLTGAINEVITNLASEVDNRTTADNTLQNNIDSLKTQLTDEVTNRTNAVDAVTANVNTNTTAISQETSDRVAVTGDLTTLTTNAKDNLVNAINEVDLNIDTEITNRTNADNQLQSNLDSGINNTNTAIGNVNADGTITIAGTHYMDSASTVSSALTILDETSHELNLNKMNKTSQLIFDEIITNNIDTNIGTRYYVDVSNNAITVTLPSTVSNFDKILFHGLSGDFSINNLTITKDINHTIMGNDEPLIVDTNDETITMVFVNNDWRIL